MLAGKPWYKSATIQGILIAGASAIMHPDVLGLLPVRYAWIGTVVGVVWSQIGLRRAIPDASIVLTDDGKRVAVHDPSGALVRHLDEPTDAHGETRAQREERQRIMDERAKDIPAIHRRPSSDSELGPR